MKSSMRSIEAELEELLGENIASVAEREKNEFDRLVSPFGRSLVLVGAGSLGRQVLACLREGGIEPLAFADNNPTLQGTNVNGVPVYSRQQVAEKYGSTAAFVVTIWNTDHSFIQTRSELTGLNCRKVVSAVSLRWKYAEKLLPFFWLDRPVKTIENADLIRSTFLLMDEEFSRREFLAQLKFRILGDFDPLSAPVPQESYFPDDLYHSQPDEQFIDCGAYDGVTVRHLLERQKEFRGKIVAYEPDPINYELLNRYRSGLPEDIRNRVIAQPYAVGAKKQKVYFDVTGTMSSSVSKSGKQEVDCVRLDENLPGLKVRPTFIKMDIEGSELDALVGGQELIRKEMPVLAICLYHRFDDLWRIPAYIKSLAGDYHLFLRPHEIEGWQLVCYAVPAGRLEG